MQNIRTFNPVLRAVGIIAAVAVLAVSVTFAALQDSATLTNNTINSGTASLTVNNEADAVFSESEEGFAFNVNPGEGPSDPANFQLRNEGDVPLDVSVQVTGESALPSGVNGDDITFVFTPDTPGACGTGLTANWTAITTAPQPLFEDFAPNNVASCDFSVTVEISDDVTTSNVTIPAFNFTFTGVSDVVEE